MDLQENGKVIPWLLVLALAILLGYFVQHRTYLSSDAGYVENLILPNGARYTGDLQRGLIHGQGKLVWPDGRSYQGQFADGSFAGAGVYRYQDGDEYRGNFVDGQLTGVGEYLGVDGSSYRGEFVNDLYHGPGEYQSSEGDQYIGVFTEGDFSGKGVFIGKNGDHYEGGFEHWQYHGLGVLTEKTGTYTGEFQHGYFDGRGEYQYRESDRLESGHWSWGKYEGVKPAANKKSHARNIEKAIYEQHRLLQLAGEQLQPSDPDAINLYFVGVAGYSRQDVFRKELEFIRTQLDTLFATEGRSLLLMNHSDTLTQFPLATTISIEQSLQLVASKMDYEKDILLLYLTSHGSDKHEFSLVQQGISLPDLSAQRLGEIVKSLPVKWKIIVVSACYSGGFIPELTSPTTLVMSAARHDRKSFGCSDDSEMTYFGRALFEHALPQANSFEDAFAISDTLITQWEKDISDDVEHSYPQILVGDEIKAYLPQWWQGLPARGPLAGSEELEVGKPPSN